MAARVGPAPATARRPRFSPIGRHFRPGPVFGKTVRDSRLGLAAVAVLLGTIVLVGGASMAQTYGSPETRRELAFLSSTLPPVMRGLYGNPVNVDTLGGFLSWHYGAYLTLLAGLWSILALSSTLAGEARRGSLEFVAGAPLSRRRLALEKLAGHVVALAIAVLLIGLAAWLAGAAFARLPGDAIPPAAAAGFAVGLGLKSLLAGAVAFALASFVGRGAAAGLAGTIMFAGFVTTSYRAVVPALAPIADLSWFAWTADHIPLAGRWDWPSLAAVGVACAVLLATGVEGFARRDIGVTSTRRTPALPGALLGLRGPLGRSFGERLPTALAWGVGLGIYGLVMAGASRSLTDEIARTPSLAETVRNLIPGIDMTTAGGFLQVVFVEFGFALIGLAAAMLVANWAADETLGRLEMLLATPLARGRWVVAGGLGTGLALAVTVGLLAAGIAVGAATAGADAATPALGTLALGVYGLALAGVGIGLGALVRASVAGPAVGVLAILTALVDLLAPALRLPEWIHELALSAHLGQPMVGSWDAVGTGLCLVLGLGGLALGGWGIRRRDIAR